MVLCSWKCAEHPVGQCSSRWLPALLDGIEFRRVCRKALDAKRFPVLSAEFIDKATMMCRPVVNKKKNASPSSQCQLNEPEKILLSLSPCESIHESSLCACAKDIDAVVLEVYRDGRMASFSGPSSYYQWYEPKCCLILRGDYKSTPFVDMHQSARFFLKRTISSGDALRWCFFLGRCMEKPS